MSEGTFLLTQAISAPAFAADQVARDVWNGLWAHPWLGALVAIVVARACVRVVRDVIHGVHPRDPVRTFSRADKTVILARAGGRCEHHSSLGGRCRQTVGLEADHVHPHSRGGWTALVNGQALCRPHNKSKAAQVPWEWQLNRLARRRADYFPFGTPTGVMRRCPRSVSEV